MSPEPSDSSEGLSAKQGSAPQRHDLRILNSIRQIIRAADIDSRKLAGEHKITGPQLMCLMAVVEKGEATAVDISRRIHVSTSTLVGVMDRLEAKGLISRRRNADDRREVVILPTDAGRSLVAQTPFPLQYSLGRALSQLPEADREELAGWMERLVNLMGADDVFAGPMLEIVGLSSGHKRT